MSDDAPPVPPLDEGAALRAVARGVEAEIGEGFFRSLVEHLARVLRVRYAFVSELSPDGRTFRTRAAWADGAPFENFETPVVGTPCERVVCGEMAFHPRDLRARYPQYDGEQDWRAESYCGVPLLDAAGGVVGHLAIFDDRPMTDPRGVDILRIFAARARAEIDRLAAEAAVRASEERLVRILDSAMDAVIAFDADDRIVLANEAAVRTFGAGAAAGARLGTALGPALGSALADLRRVLDGPEAPPHVPAPRGLVAHRGDGTAFAAEATLSAATWRGRPLFTLVLRDIDERRRLEQALGDLAEQNAYLLEELRAVHHAEEVVGHSPALRAVLDQAHLVAPTDSSVLILGESGTGKELLARAIHARSRRAARPLVKVNCAALPAGLVESELFGHERGAFTGAQERRHGRFELAAGGTIFLDEIGELPLDTQAKLLRVLQEQEFERVGGSTTLRVDVRVIAATNRDLAAAVDAGTFRSDLFYRLNVFPLVLPPLRDRPGDVPLLVHLFVQRYAPRIGRRITRVPAATMARLVAYPWPGNVRELENVVERAVILSPGPDLEIPEEALAARPAPVAGPAVVPDPPAATETAGTLGDVERRHIVEVLRRTGWRIDGPQGAARILELHPNTLRSRMKRLGIRRSHDEGS